MKTMIFTLIHCEQRDAKNEKEMGSKKSTAKKKKEITLSELLSAIKKSKLAKKSTRRR